MATELLTTKQAGERLGLEEWQVRFVFTQGHLPEPPKFGGKRVIDTATLRKIKTVATNRGWLKPVVN